MTSMKKEKSVIYCSWKICPGLYVTSMQLQEDMGHKNVAICSCCWWLVIIMIHYIMHFYFH